MSPELVEDMFYTNAVSFNYGYYPHSWLQDNFGTGPGHTNWSPVFLPEWGFEGQPDFTAGMTLRALGWSTKAAAKLFIHEATQMLVAKYGHAKDLAYTLDDLLGESGSCGCSAE